MLVRKMTHYGIFVNVFTIAQVNAAKFVRFDPM
jgi:hypothetical protein